MKIAIVAIVAAAGTAAANMTEVTVSSIDDGSAEIRNDGVRLFNGEVSTAFWNVQPAGQFATVAVMQFDATAIAQAANDKGLDAVEDVHFSLFQDIAGFTSPQATLDFWWASTDLDLTVDGLNGVNFANALASFGAQKIAEDYTYVRGSQGDKNLFSIFGEGLAGQAGFEADLLAGGLITIIATSDDGVASWAGAENIRDFDDPSITVKLIPAPGAVALLGLGSLAAIRRRR